MINSYAYNYDSFVDLSVDCEFISTFLRGSDDLDTGKKKLKELYEFVISIFENMSLEHRKGNMIEAERSIGNKLKRRNELLIDRCCFLEKMRRNGTDVDSSDVQSVLVLFDDDIGNATKDILKTSLGVADYYNNDFVFGRKRSVGDYVYILSSLSGNDRTDKNRALKKIYSYKNND